MDSTSKSLEAQLADALRHQEELRRSLQSCEASLAQAKREIEQGWGAAKEANEELQQFVYAASHDLQQPLRTIGTYAQLLQREYANDTHAGEFTSFIIDGTNQMSALIRDLLTYSRTGGSSRRANINLNGPLQWALLKLAQAIREAGAKVTTSDMPEVYADEMQLAQVFNCIIDNSLKYKSAKAPEIQVWAEQEPDEVAIAIKDNGQGIEPRFHEQVFLPFKRLHGKNIPGSGLGLTISRKIIRAHGGRIWIESDGQLGSTVKFTLPV